MTVQRPTRITQAKRRDQWLEALRSTNGVALWQNTPWSARKIAPFVQKHKIDMSEFEPGPFRSYADFFDRRFCRGGVTSRATPIRWVPSAKAAILAGNGLIPPCFSPSKARRLNLSVCSAQKSASHPLSAVRSFSPACHRWTTIICTFPMTVTSAMRSASHRLWTAIRQPCAISGHPVCNERHIQELETDHFGRLAFVEVGALSVGRIVQVHKEERFRRGEEKSVFKFGGSAVVMIGEKGAWKPADDILAHTQEGIETFVRLGDVIAARVLAPAETAQAKTV